MLLKTHPTHTPEKDKVTVPSGNLSPALSTSLGIDNGSFVTINCFGTPTLPIRARTKIGQGLQHIIYSLHKRLKGNNYHGSQTNSDLPRPEAWTGGCVDVVLHLVDQGQLLLDVFVCNPSKGKREKSKAIVKLSALQLPNNETLMRKHRGQSKTSQDIAQVVNGEDEIELS